MRGNWQRCRLGDIGQVVTGRTPPATAPKFFGTDVPFLTPTDMDGRRRVGTTARFLSAEGATYLSRVTIPHGVAVSCIGWQMGKSLLVDRPVITNQQINSVIPRGSVANDEFLYYTLTAMRDQIFGLGAGGSRTPILNKSGFEDLIIPVPPLPEQRAIAHILSTLDDKIELNRRRNQTLEAMARALFQGWFVDFDPVRAKMEGREPYLPPDLWQLFPDRLDDEGKPEGWDERSLDEVADFLNGLALQKFPAIDAIDSLPVVKIAELRNGISTKSDRASRKVPTKYIIKDGDFLFSWSGSLLAKFWTEGEGALNQHLFKVTSGRYPMWFVSHWVQHHLEEFQAIAASKATTMGHIQRGHLKTAMTICPPDDVVGRMGIVMAPLVKQAIQNELESRNLAQLRDTLLPKLISGELRIADTEKFVQAAQ